MSPVRHKITGSALSFSLAEELQIVRGQLGSASARIGRTLVKDGPLRVTMVGLNAGGTLRPHKAEGPITLHVIEGEIDLEADDKSWTLATGALFSLGAGITHSVSTKNGGIFLLTVVTLAPATEQE